MIWREEGDSTEVQIVYRLWYVSLSRIVCLQIKRRGKDITEKAEDM